MLKRLMKKFVKIFKEDEPHTEDKYLLQLIVHKENIIDVTSAIYTEGRLLNKLDEIIEKYNLNKETITHIPYETSSYINRRIKTSFGYICIKIIEITDDNELLTSNIILK